MQNFSTNSLAMVLSSTHYHKNDYIHDYKKYLIYTQSPLNELKFAREYCETNGKDYLKQFEYASVAGNASCSTGGGFGLYWNVMYSKNLNGQNYLFVAKLNGRSQGDYWHFQSMDVTEYCTEEGVCYDFDSKEYLDYLLEMEENQHRLAEWDKFVQSLELIK
jgi:hypothetical protein